MTNLAVLCGPKAGNLHLYETFQIIFHGTLFCQKLYKKWTTTSSSSKHFSDMSCTVVLIDINIIIIIAFLHNTDWSDYDTSVSTSLIILRMRMVFKTKKKSYIFQDVLCIWTESVHKYVKSYEIYACLWGGLAVLWGPKAWNLHETSSTVTVPYLFLCVIVLYNFYFYFLKIFW